MNASFPPLGANFPTAPGVTFPAVAPKGLGMAACPHTGITVPECSCRSCLQALLEQHAPAEADQTEATEVEPFRRRRLGSRLRRLRLRRVA